MNYTPINLKDKFQKFTEHWSPKIIAQMNNYHLKIARGKGEFVWHKHDDTDEVFLLIEGDLTIHFEDGYVNLRPGEIFVIPKGVMHKTEFKEESKFLFIEPEGTANTGDTHNSLTSEDEWI